VTMISKYILLLLMTWLLPSCSLPEDDLRSFYDDPMAMALSVLIRLIAAGIWDSGGACTRTFWLGTRGPTIKHACCSVSSITYELGGYSRQYYQMENHMFWKLHRILHKKIKNPTVTRKRKHGSPPNGKISSSIRLSCALRYFAGGEAMALALVHGISHSDVFNSVWLVVDAIH